MTRTILWHCTNPSAHGNKAPAFAMMPPRKRCYGCGSRCVPKAEGLRCDSERGGCGATITLGIVGGSCPWCGHKGLRLPESAPGRAA